MGEPPFTVANSVYFALKGAVAAARAESTALRAAGRAAEHFELPCPATAAALQQACCVTPQDFQL